jgi:hypothetical protein
VHEPAGAVWQPAQAWFTQNAFAGSAVQWVLSLHSTQVLVAGLHTRIPASLAQFALPVHSTQVPVSALHTGRAGFLVAQLSADTPGAPQPTQVCALPQMGRLASLQSVWTRHSTHWLVAK